MSTVRRFFPEEDYRTLYVPEFTDGILHKGWFSGRPLRSEWITLTTRWDPNDQHPKPDLVYAGEPICGPRAVEVLHDLWTSHGELVPIEVEGEPDPYFVLNVTRLLDILDEERSKVQRVPSGIITGVIRWRFHEARIPKEPTLFKIPKLGGSYLFANEAAALLIEQAGLTGYRMKRLF